MINRIKKDKRCQKDESYYASDCSRTHRQVSCPNGLFGLKTMCVCCTTVVIDINVYQLNNCLVGFCNFIVQRLSSPLFYIGKLRYRMILYKCLEMFYNNTQLIQTELNQTKVNHTELSHI